MANGEETGTNWFEDSGIHEPLHTEPDPENDHGERGEILNRTLVGSSGT